MLRAASFRRPKGERGNDPAMTNPVPMRGPAKDVPADLARTAAALPLVSILVNNRNYRAFVGDAIASALAQDYPRIEICVVDDASTDESWALIAALAARHPDRIAAVRHDENLGQLAAVRTGLAHTRGPFVVILDADDMLMPGFAAAHVAAHLNRAQAASVSTADMMLVDAAGALLAATKSSIDKPRIAARANPSLETLVRNPGEAEIDPALAGRADDLLYLEPAVGGWHWSPTSGNMLRRAAIELAMPEDCAPVRRSVDCYLLPMLHAMSGTLVIPRPLALYRRHGENGYGRNPFVGNYGETGARPRSYDQGIRAAAMDQAMARRDEYLRVFRPEGLRRILESQVLTFPELDEKLCAAFALAPELLPSIAAVDALLRQLARRHGRRHVHRFLADLRPAIVAAGGRAAWRRYALKYGWFYRYLR